MKQKIIEQIKASVGDLVEAHWPDLESAAAENDTMKANLALSITDNDPAEVTVKISIPHMVKDEITARVSDQPELGI